MTIEGEARAEAVRRYRLSRVEQVNAPSLAELNERIEAGNGFIAGAVWVASRHPSEADSEALHNKWVEGWNAAVTEIDGDEPSEAEVEAALKVLGDEGFLPTNVYGNEHYEGYWRDVAKTALEAARTARGEQK